MAEHHESPLETVAQVVNETIKDAINETANALLTNTTHKHNDPSSSSEEQHIHHLATVGGSEEEELNSEEQTHKLYIKSIFMLLLIVITINLHGICHKYKIHFLSETALTIILGFSVALVVTLFAVGEEHTSIQLSSKFFYMVLLPPIIFEGGFNLRKVSFFKNFLTIVSLAFIGAFFSTLLTSVIMYYLSKLVFPFSFIESLVFGSLISSTDPVTVLSLLPKNVDRRLYMFLFGESALNDAVSIILYKFFTSIADPHMRLGVGPFLMSVVSSSGVFFGSMLCGSIVGLSFSKITKHVQMHDRTMYETTMLLVMGYLSYLIADVSGLTGIISIFFCGITMAHYGYHNLSKETNQALKVNLRFISSLSEGCIFIYLGLGLLSFGGKTTYNPLMILFSCLTILVSRCHIFIIIGIRNALSPSAKDRVPLNHQILMWFSGLRGAVAFALAVTFLEHPVFDEDVKGVIFGTTVIVIVLTVLILGGFTPNMLRLLHISGPTSGGSDHVVDLDPANNGNEEGGLGKMETAYEELHDEANDDDDPESPAQSESLFMWLYRMDTTYMRHFFSTPPPPVIIDKTGNNGGGGIDSDSKQGSSVLLKAVGDDKETSFFGKDGKEESIPLQEIAKSNDMTDVSANL